MIRLGYFLVLLGYKISYKSSPNSLVNFQAILNNLMLRMIRLLYWPILGKNGQLLFYNLVTLLAAAADTFNDAET